MLAIEAAARAARVVCAGPRTAPPAPHAPASASVHGFFSGSCPAGALKGEGAVGWVFARHRARFRPQAELEEAFLQIKAKREDAVDSGDIGAAAAAMAWRVAELEVLANRLRHKLEVAELACEQFAEALAVAATAEPPQNYPKALFGQEQATVRARLGARVAARVAAVSTLRAVPSRACVCAGGDYVVSGRAEENRSAAPRP